MNRSQAMNRIMIAAMASVILASCTGTDRLAFHRMTEIELLAYNETVEVPDWVYCFDEVRTGSFIRKRYCLTLLEILAALEDNSHALGVVNYGARNRYTPGYNQGSGFD